MRNYLKGIFAIAAVAIGLSACTTVELFEEADTLAQTHYITVAVFNEYDKIGKAIFDNVNTPTEVKVGLNKARQVAVAALRASNDAFITVGEIQARLEEVPDQTVVDELTVAGQVLREKVDTAKGHVDAFKSLVQSLDD